jgi:hypothetical protein
MNPRRIRTKRRKPFKNHDGGVRFKVPSHPPSFTAIPWYNLVLRIVDPPATITTVSIQAALASQLAVSFIASLANVRLRSVRLWASLVQPATPAALVPLSVTILDPLAASFTTTLQNRVLESLIDYPDAVRRACVGYKYPKAQSEVSLAVSNANPVNLLNIQGAGAGSVLYFYLQWRSGVVGAPPALDNLSNSLSEFVIEENDDDEYVDRIVDRLEREHLLLDDNGRISSSAIIRSRNKLNKK